jgi:sulfate permease, SulP family
VLLFGSYAEKVPLAIIGGMLTVIGVELIMARLPSARLVIRTGAWGPIVAMALTFFSSLFIPLQWAIFLGAFLSLLLYVGASSRKFRLQHLVHLDDGGWEVQDAPKTLPSNQATMLVVQGLDFFAEVPALDDEMPPARGVSNAVVILVLRDMHQVTSTAIKWLEGYARNLKANGSLLMLADVNPKVRETLERSDALDILGTENVVPATKRVLDSENMAWNAAQEWLQAHQAVKS